MQETAECEFGLFAVDSTLQGKGIGASLLRAAEEAAKSQFDASFAVLHVLTPRKELIAFYERRGYKPTGIEIPFPSTNARGEFTKVDSLVMGEFKKQL